MTLPTLPCPKDCAPDWCEPVSCPVLWPTTMEPRQERPRLTVRRTKEEERKAG